MNATSDMKPWETHGTDTGSKWTCELPYMVRWTIREAGYVHGPNPVGLTYSKHFADEVEAIEAAKLPFKGKHVEVTLWTPDADGPKTRRIFRRTVPKPIIPVELTREVKLRSERFSGGRMRSEIDETANPNARVFYGDEDVTEALQTPVETLAAGTRATFVRFTTVGTRADRRLIIKLTDGRQVEVFNRSIKKVTS